MVQKLTSPRERGRPKLTVVDNLLLSKETNFQKMAPNMIMLGCYFGLYEI